MFWLWLWLWRWWLCWWWSCPEASHAGGCAQKPATRGYCPEARHAGGWDFRFWLWWWRGAGKQGRYNFPFPHGPKSAVVVVLV